MPARIPYDPSAVAAFCQKWKVTELALFGSVLREDFTADSDVDVMVTFDDPFWPSLWEWPQMMDELQVIFGRRIDLVEKKSITNPVRHHHIMKSHEVIHAA